MQSPRAAIISGQKHSRKYSGYTDTELMLFAISLESNQTFSSLKINVKVSLQKVLPRRSMKVYYPGATIKYLGVKNADFIKLKRCSSGKKSVSASYGVSSGLNI